MILISHYKMADLAIAHGFLVLVTGLMLLFVKAGLRRNIRAIHVSLGIMTSVYGLLTYLVTP